MDAFVY